MDPRENTLPTALTDEAIQYPGGNLKRIPFFCIFPFYSIHTPLQGRPDLKKKYENNTQGSTPIMRRWWSAWTKMWVV